MTLGEWQARLIEKSAIIMSHFVETTREDRLRWRPSTEEASQTRSVMEQLGECIFANQRFLAIFRGDEPATPPASFDSFGEVPEATALLKSSAAALAAEVRKLKGDDLMKTVQTHRGPMPAALAMQFPVRNMTYHMGQMNMIQLLYGDTAFHITEEFTTL
ncbi:hypothetical protein OP10G_0586 [Fimbriimonas ginsengisoli Gsoil 348]|uniref:DinB-like domain-containing protein n=2 Tax=Fimbriimonas ginsengisoli TaxID=1005039 RepID=A0A068NQT1_FIMGI|nr:hypothetical protein OP10G_0586 [Fimbriimonas ginsengisoli Gsoil 348]